MFKAYVRDLSQFFWTPIPQVDRTNTSSKLGIGANHIVTPMADRSGHDFYSETDRLFKSLCDLHLNSAVHVVKIIQQNHKVAVTDFVHDLSQPQTLADAF